ncbi:helix-turn-helix domain-containing protein [Listeria monocytogenes]|nr:DNA-binding protein [Listeria monocytogenes]EJC6460098.1 helix-turn-helix domain-containing protein [Listeria monocytogenes]MCM64488.1 DNA-binding protein [Listeria monocytogenes]
MEIIKKSELDSLLVNYVPKRYLTQKEAVKYTGTSPATINDWVKQGMSVIIFTEKSRPKYDTRDLDEWMDKHKV